MNWDHSVIFEIAPKYCISISFVDYEGTLFFFLGILAHNSRYNGHLNPCPKKECSWKLKCSLISQMSMFNFAISQLTVSNLPWFMDLTFQVPMQHCSLHHQNLLSLPDTSTTECYFHFGPVASFFLGLLVINCSLLFPYWTPSNLGSSSSSVINFAFACCSWRSHSKNTAVVCHSLLQWRGILTMFCQNSPLWPCFVRTLHYDLSILGGPVWHGSELHWFTQASSPWQGCNPWRGCFF